MGEGNIMIYFYSGTPGSGKSLHVARDIYWFLRTGGCVIANFEINREVFIKRDKKNPKIIKKNYNRGTCLEVSNFMLNPQFLTNYARAFFKRDEHGRIKEGQCKLVIDECQLIFNARSWNVAGRDLWCSFFTQHRKFGYDIILISQFDRMVDRQIRALIEYEVVHRKMNNYRIMGKIVGFLYGGSAFIAITKWYQMGNCKEARIGSETFSVKKRYCDFYNSYKIF
jgi:zona occludens toxin (predicted ATPase)